MIEASSDNNVGIALTYAASAPLAWVPAGLATVDEFDLANEQCLRTILSLNEHHSVDVAEDIAVIERKVDITLEMVATLLRASVDMPASVSFEIGAHNICWQQEGALPELGSDLIITIYLHELYPKPVTFFGRVKTILSQECTVELAPKPIEVQEQLEKFIFLHHRRAIAQAKKS